MAPKKETSLNFETALKELETLVATLEEGELSLEDSLKTFEQGIKLTRTCQTALQQAEQKVQILLQDNDGLKTEPFDPDVPK